MELDQVVVTKDCFCGRPATVASAQSCFADLDGQTLSKLGQWLSKTVQPIVAAKFSNCFSALFQSRPYSGAGMNLHCTSSMLRQTFESPASVVVFSIKTNRSRLHWSEKRRRIARLEMQAGNVLPASHYLEWTTIRQTMIGYSLQAVAGIPKSK
jgi:hypothetical protein